MLQNTVKFVQLYLKNPYPCIEGMAALIDPAPLAKTAPNIIAVILPYLSLINPMIVEPQSRPNM